jgi:hypothetical protein
VPQFALSVAVFTHKPAQRTSSERHAPPSLLLSLAVSVEASWPPSTGISALTQPMNAVVAAAPIITIQVR